MDIQAPNQQSVVLVDPTGQFGKAVVVVLVEVNPGIHRNGADTIAVQIKHERASGNFGLVEEALEAVHKVGKR